jgi:hypothetical protein
MDMTIVVKKVLRPRPAQVRAAVFKGEQLQNF